MAFCAGESAVAAPALAAQSMTLAGWWMGLAKSGELLDGRSFAGAIPETVREMGGRKFEI
jgi:hypothetical protein